MSKHWSTEREKEMIGLWFFSYSDIVKNYTFFDWMSWRLINYVRLNARRIYS